MQSDSVEPFPDNWTYLKAELNWLDRVLSLAVARQRKETKEVDRFARTRADRATSHWWKGLMSLEGDIAFDSPAEMPRRRTGKGGYQQQLEAKIQANEQQGICLGLPSLRRQLQLSAFEKNLVLMALAPEISRRYGLLYNYLQETEQSSSSGLPTVDLLLRILCRNDAEWRVGRQCLIADSALLRHQLLEVRSRLSESGTPQPEALLTRLVKLSDPLTSYLLADQPNAADLRSLLHPTPHLFSPPHLPTSPSPSSPPSLPTPHTPHPTPWSSLILPPSLLDTLQHLCHRLQLTSQVDEQWGFGELADPSQMGITALLMGAPGTGKTTAAKAIAQTLTTPILIADLALLNTENQAQLLETVAEQMPTVLLLKSAQVWLGQSPSLPETTINQFLQWRQQQRSITLFSVHRKQSVKIHWRNQMAGVLEFPVPDAASRSRLWQQAFPSQVPLDETIDWEHLSQQFPLTGGEIRAIAREAAFYAASEAPEPKLGWKHLMQALSDRQIKPRVRRRRVEDAETRRCGDGESFEF